VQLVNPAVCSWQPLQACDLMDIVSEQYCGLSLGWPLVQCQLVVSSTWALLYYKEVSILPAVLLAQHQQMRVQAVLSLSYLLPSGALHAAVFL